MTTTIDATLARRVNRGSGENAYKCYQCKKCSTGCPVAGFGDLHPAQIMRAVQLGAVDSGRRQPLHLAVHRLRDVHHALPAGHRHRGHHGRAAHDRPRRGPGALRRAVRQHPQAQLRLVPALGPALRGRAARPRQGSPGRRASPTTSRMGIRMFLKGKINPLPTMGDRCADEAHGRSRRPHHPRQAGRRRRPWTCPPRRCPAPSARAEVRS